MRKHFFYLVLLVFSYWVLKPLFYPGFFTIHDGAQTARIYEMKKAILDGQFPPRWAEDLGYGYGYPQFNFYSPLPYYVGAIIAILGLDYLIATKVVFAICIIFSGIFMYVLGKEFWGRLGGLVAAVFYIYCPYFALDLYVRGALAEAWAMMFIPLVVFGIWKLKETGGKRYFFLLVLAFSGLILSHNITVMIFSMGLGVALLGYFVFLVLKRKKSTPFFLVLAAIIFAFGTTCYFWLPAIIEAEFTHIRTMIKNTGNYHLHFIAFRQIWDSPWDFGGSAGIYSGLSFMLGKLHLILGFLAVFNGVYFWRKKRKLSLVLFSAVFCLLVSIFMTNSRSVFIWERLSNLAFVQFPWRFLAFGAFFCSFLAGSYFVLFEKKKTIRFLLTVVFIGLVIFLNKNYFRPKKYLDVDSSYYLKGEKLYQWGSSMSEEYLPIWREKKSYQKPEEKVEIIKGKGKIDIYKKKSNLYYFRVDLEKEGFLKVNVNYFPGWRVLVDNEKEDIFYKDDGLIKFSVEKGVHEVMVEFNDRGIRFLADLTSLFFWVFLLFGTRFVLKFRHE